MNRRTRWISVLLIVIVMSFLVFLGRYEIKGIIFREARFQGHPTGYWKRRLQDYPINYHFGGGMTIIPYKGGKVRGFFVDQGVLESFLVAFARQAQGL
jgi:hypothetical protein